jgi:hypothetical protein
MYFHGKILNGGEDTVGAQPFFLGGGGGGLEGGRAHMERKGMYVKTPPASTYRDYSKRAGETTLTNKS